MIANAISKILGAIFKIPITYILQEEGMAIYNTAFQVYIMMLTFAISGTPVAISKMVAENMALHKENDVHKIIRVSEYLLAIIGIIGTLALFFGADFFAVLMKDAKTVYSIKAIAPAIFFVAIGTAYKSYYQGVQNMIPTAISQVVESVIKLFVGYGLALYFISCQSQITSAATLWGITIGEIIATAILLVMYLPDKRSYISTKSTLSGRKIVANIMKIAIPLTLASSVSSILSVIDISMIRSRLQAITFTAQTAESLMLKYSPFTTIFDNLQNTLKIGEEGARWLYGAYSGYALTIFHLPAGIVSAFGVSVLPVIAGAFALKDMKRASKATQLALRISVLIALPCACAMFMLSDPILRLLFKNTASAPLLSIIAPCIVSVCLVSISCAVLQAAGKIMLPFKNMLIGSAIKLILNYVLIATPELNIFGAPISTNIDYLVVAILNLYDIKKIMGIKYDFKSILLKPIIATIVMSIIIYLIYQPLCLIFASDIWGFCIASLFGGVSYILVLVLIGAISWHEAKEVFKRI